MTAPEENHQTSLSATLAGARSGELTVPLSNRGKVTAFYPFTSSNIFAKFLLFSTSTKLIYLETLKIAYILQSNKR